MNAVDRHYQQFDEPIEFVAITSANLQAQFDRQNEGVEFEVVYDESTYIDQSVSNVRGDLITGGVLAIAVLLLFSGSLSTVVVVAISIPIAMIVVFIVSAILWNVALMTAQKRK